MGTPNPNPSSIRALVRPPPTPTNTTGSTPTSYSPSQTLPLPSSSPSSDPPPSDGVVVFCSTRCPALDDGSSDSVSGFDSPVEEHEFGDLQALLFMFSFRVFQAAKNDLAPFVRYRTVQPTPSRPPSSLSSSRPTTSSSFTSKSSQGISGGILTRNASAISLMSGFGSYTSLFPGQCTPVTLVSSLVRPSMPVKGLGSVVVLARPVSKSESSFRKKLHSSLEAQICFLIKKSRTLSGSESSHGGSRSGGANSAPLFSLDASRAVLLLDRSTNQRGESLEFATGLVEDVLNGKATLDSLLLESHGGSVNNSSSGSAAGVGMVAVAAASAASSSAAPAASSSAAPATSGKQMSTPELPNFQIWLSSSQQVLHGILSAKGGCLDETETSKRKPHPRNTVPQQAEGVSSKGRNLKGWRLLLLHQLYYDHYSKNSRLTPS
ncbi:hypothetical protein ACFX2F_006622 [Malus domestica]